MPRALRIQYAGAVYHIMSRGQRREAIVYDEKDREVFFATVSEVCERTGWRLHAWVLLGNHYHWLLETPEANLVSGMQWFQTTYSTRFRLRHGLAGHVFQGRYKAIVIDPDSDTYFQTVSGYIHLNPVRAKGVLGADEPLEHFRWSSYSAYLRRPGLRPQYLVVDGVLGNLGLADDRNGRRRYREHMEARRAEWRAGRRQQEAEWKSLRRGWCLGSREFRNQMLERVKDLLGERAEGSMGGEVVREHNESAARQAIAEALVALNLDAKALPGMKKTDGRKRAIAWWVRTRSTVSNRWVAEALHMGHAMNASASVRLVREAKGNDLARMRRRMEKTLRF